MKMRWPKIVLVVLGAIGAGGAIWADDEPNATNQPRVRALAVRVAGKHWLGVHAVPVDEALKSQLGIEDRLILAHVVPESPADKAGLKQHDILLRLGDREITSMPDLLSAVEKNEDRETKATVLRGGQEMQVNVQPTDQPSQEAVIEWEHALPGQLEWKEWLDRGQPLGLRMVGPGVFAFAQTEAELPNNLSISVTKQGSEPAKIIVKRDDQTWEGTEDDLDKCPEDLRGYVERALGHNPHPRLHLHTREGGQMLLAPQPIPHALAQPRRVEVYERRVGEGDPIQGLRQEIEALRRVIEKLEQKISPSNPQKKPQ